MSNWVAHEHQEWHYENGPSGPYGVACPWDACGWAFADDAEQEYRAAQAECTDADPEDYAELDALLRDEAAEGAPDPWLEPLAFTPPF